MGVKQLWNLLAPVGRPVLLETMEGKALAIDSSIWIYQFQATMRDKDGRGLVNAHILGFLRRICKLLYYGIKPVFVFDGGAPALKRSTLNERRKKKSGAADSHVRVAERLLAAQLRREALNHASKAQARRNAQPGPQVQGHGSKEDIEVSIQDDAVYLEDLEPGAGPPRTPAKQTSENVADGQGTDGPSSGSNSKKESAEKARRNKWQDHDPYKLPEIDFEAAVAKATSSTMPDPRLATEEELRAFIEDMRPEDFDVNSEAFRELPTEVQYEIIGDLRLKSRQTSHKRLQAMLRKAETPLDFSKAQIQNLKQRNNITQQLLVTLNLVDKANLTIPVRVASERNREYILIRNDDAAGGWVLGIRDEGTQSKPIEVDLKSDSDGEGSSPKRSSPSKSRTSKQDSDLREFRQQMALAAIAKRQSPKKRPPEKPKPLPTPSKPLFIEDEDEEVEGATEGWEDVELDPATLVALNESLEDAEDASMQRAMDESLQTASAELSRIRQAAAPEPDSEEDDLYEAPQPTQAAPPMKVTVSNTSSGGTDEPPVMNRVAAASLLFGLPTMLLDEDEPAQAEASGSNGSWLDPQSVPDSSRDSDSDSSMEEVVLPTSRSASSLGPMSHEATLDDSNSDDMEELVIERPTPSTAPSLAKPKIQPSVFSLDSDSDDEMEEVTLQQPMAEPLNLPSRTPMVPAPKAAASRNPLAAAQAPPRSAPSKTNPTAVPQARQTTTPSKPSRTATASFNAAATPPAVSPVTAVSLTLSPPERPQPPPTRPSAHRPLSPEQEVPDLSDLDPTPAAKGVPNLFHANESSPDSPTYSPPRHQSSVVSDDEDPITDWSRSPSPETAPAAAAGPSSSKSNRRITKDFDAADEMDPDAEEGDFAAFISQVKGKDLDAARKEVDDEILALNKEKKAAMRDSEEVTMQMIGQIKVMLRLFGIPYVTAPMEAEAQCATLVQLGLVDGIITDDSDVFLFGGLRVFRNMFNQSKTVEVYLLSDLQRELGLGREKLVNLAYLLGSDYVDGLVGVGPVVAMEILKEFEGRVDGDGDGIDEEGGGGTGLGALKDFREWWAKVQSGRDGEKESGTKFRRRFKKKFKDLYLPEDWPNPVVRDAYYHPAVDDSREAFKWALPDIEGLRKLLKEELSWSQGKVDETLLPIVKRVGQRGQAHAINKQSNLNAFFDISAGSGTYAPKRGQAYASKRLQKVVSDFRKGKKATLEEEGQGSEEEEEAEGSGAGAGKGKGKGKAKAKPKPKPKAKKTKKGKEKAVEDDGESSPAAAAASAKRTRKPSARKKRKIAVVVEGSTDDDDDDEDQPPPGDDDAGKERAAALSLRPRPKPRPRYTAAASSSIIEVQVEVTADAERGGEEEEGTDTGSASDEEEYVPNGKGKEKRKR